MGKEPIEVIMDQLTAYGPVDIKIDVMPVKRYRFYGYRKDGSKVQVKVETFTDLLEAAVKGVTV